MRLKIIFTLLFTFIASYITLAQVNLENGLLAKYNFSENALDKSGNGNDAIIHGATLAEDRFGIPNSAYDIDGNVGLNGSDVFIEIPNVVDGLNNLTISIWVKHNNYCSSSYGETYISYGTLPAMGTVSTSIYYSNENNNLEFVVMTSTGKNFCAIPFQDSWIGKWQHYVLVFDGDNGVLKGYLNMNLVALKEGIQGNVYAIGNYGGINKHWWANGAGQSTRINGLFDDVRVYNRALNTEEIENLYSEGICYVTIYDTISVSQTIYDTITISQTIYDTIPVYDTIQIDLESGLLAKYDFNGSALDKSGNGNDAIVNGATLAMDRFGIPNSAYEIDGNVGLNGSDIFIEIPNIVDGMNNLTISIWVKHNNYSSSSYGETYISFGTLPAMGTVSTSIYYSNENNNLEFVVMTSTGKNFCAIPFQDSWIGTWQHYTLVYDGDNGILNGYLNGNLVASKEDIQGSVYAIGNYGGINKHWWANGEGQSTRINGLFDDVRVYNRALNPKEIKNLYSETKYYEIVYDTVVVFDTIHTIIQEYVSVTDTLIMMINTDISSHENSIKVYPNPTKDLLYINLGNNYPEIGNNKLLISNEIGQIVFEDKMDKQIITIELNKFGTSGLYLITILNSDNEIVNVRKILLE